MEHFSEKPARTIVESVSREIIAAIQELRLLPGQRLVEADLCTELRVSRTPLREALSRLAAVGIVEMTPHRGACIPILDADELVEMLDVRQVLEGLAARLAAKSTDRTARNKLERIVGDFPDDGHMEIGMNARFHSTIMQMSGNQQLIASLEPLYVREFFLRSFRYNVGPDDEREQTEQHRTIAQAILARDAGLAEKLARDHVESNLALVARRVAEITSRPPVSEGKRSSRSRALPSRG